MSAKAAVISSLDWGCRVYFWDGSMAAADRKPQPLATSTSSSLWHGCSLPPEQNKWSKKKPQSLLWPRVGSHTLILLLHAILRSKSLIPAHTKDHLWKRGVSKNLWTYFKTTTVDFVLSLSWQQSLYFPLPWWRPGSTGENLTLYGSCYPLSLLLCLGSWALMETNSKNGPWDQAVVWFPACQALPVSGASSPRPQVTVTAVSWHI